MISIGKPNNTSSKITPTESNDYSPIKIGNPKGKAVNVTKMFIGDRNGRAKEIYFTPLYDYRHTFMSITLGSAIQEIVPDVTVTVSTTDNRNRDPKFSYKSCDKMTIIGTDNYSSIGCGYFYTFSNGENDIDIPYYDRLYKYRDYISDLTIRNVKMVDGTSYPNICNGFKNVEYIEFDNNLTHLVNSFNNFENLSTVVFNSLNIPISYYNLKYYNFSNMKNNSVILFDRFTGSQEDLSTVCQYFNDRNDFKPNTIIYKAVLDPSTNEKEYVLNANNSMIQLSQSNSIDDLSTSPSNYADTFIDTDSLNDILGTFEPLEENIVLSSDGTLLDDIDNMYIEDLDRLIL